MSRPTPDEDPMPGDGGPGPADLSRLVLARASARMSVSRAGDAYGDALIRAFRDEMALVVRAVSPVLTALLDEVGIDFDAVAWEIAPASGWPDRPRLPASRSAYGKRRGRRRSSRLHRPSCESACDPPLGCHGVDVVLPDGRRIAVHVVDHVIEVTGTLGDLRYATRAGTLRVEMPAGLPLTLLAACFGRSMEEVVDYPAFRGRGWTVVSFGRGVGGASSLVAETGLTSYKVPWSGRAA